LFLKQVAAAPRARMKSPILALTRLTPIFLNLMDWRSSGVNVIRFCFPKRKRTVECRE